MRDECFYEKDVGTVNGESLVMLKSSAKPTSTFSRLRTLLWVCASFAVLLGTAVVAVLSAPTASAAGGTTISIGYSTFNRTDNGYLSGGVGATISNYTSPGQPCSGGVSNYTCTAALEVQDSAGVETLNAKALNGSASSGVDLGATANLTKVTAWRVSVYGTDDTGHAASYSTGWTAVSDPYSVTSVAFAPASNFDRRANGFAEWTAAAQVTGFDQPDEVCGNSDYTCTVSLQMQYTDGSFETVNTGTLQYGHSYPQTLSLTTINRNLLKVAAWRLVVSGTDFRLRAGSYVGAWVPLTDTYSTTSATIMGSPSSGFDRRANGFAEWTAVAQVSGFSQPDEVCGNDSASCTVSLQFQHPDGSIETATTGSLRWSNDYPQNVSVTTINVNLRKVNNWRVVVSGKDAAATPRSYTGPWTSVEDSYTTTAATILNPPYSGFDRRANGFAEWTAVGQVSGFSQPDEVCGNSAFDCNVSLPSTAP